MAILLVLSIALMVFLIQITQHVKRIVAKAESVADSVEAAGDFFRKSAGPVAVTKIIANIVESYKTRKKED